MLDEIGRFTGVDVLLLIDEDASEAVKKINKLRETSLIKIRSSSVTTWVTTSSVR